MEIFGEVPFGGRALRYTSVAKYLTHLGILKTGSIFSKVRPSRGWAQESAEQLRKSEKVRKNSELAGQLQNHSVQLRPSQKFAPYCRNSLKQFSLGINY